MMIIIITTTLVPQPTAMFFEPFFLVNGTGPYLIEDAVLSRLFQC